MRQFKEDVRVVLTAVQSLIYLSDSVSFHQKVYEEFEHFMGSNNCDYSDETISRWIDQNVMQIEDMSIRKRYKQCIVRLRDVKNKGEIVRAHLWAEKIVISEVNKRILEQFLVSYSQTHPKSSVYICRWANSLFLRYLEGSGITDLHKISISVCEQYAVYSEPIDKSSLHKTGMFISSFFIHLEECQIIPNGMHWYFKYYEAVKPLCEYSLHLQNKILSIRNEETDFDENQFLFLIDNSLSFFEKQDFEGMLRTSRRAYYLLFIFLLRENIPYNPSIAEEWVNENHDTFKGVFKIARRALDVMKANFENTPVTRRSSCVGKKCPEWAKDVYQEFIDLKKNEGFKNSTISMFEVCIKNFLVYLDLTGISSYDEITPGIIHAFNRDDKNHKTNYSKNAYNTRVRNYLKYLELHEITSMPGLSYALEKTSSSGERIVEILDPDDEKTILEFCHSAKSPMDLRDSAIVLLGLLMGLRASDVANLDMYNIDFKNRLITFVQLKTQTEVCLPMPITVGNAIFRYLVEGRKRGFNTTKLPIRCKCKDAKA